MPKNLKWIIKEFPASHNQKNRDLPDTRNEYFIRNDGSSREEG